MCFWCGLFWRNGNRVGNLPFGPVICLRVGFVSGQARLGWVEVLTGQVGPVCLGWGSPSARPSHACGFRTPTGCGRRQCCYLHTPQLAQVVISLGVMTPTM